jgi:uncharacterized protein YjiS (DUF1127 family)
MAQLLVRCASATSAHGQSRALQLIGWLKRAVEISRQRRALYRLDDAALSDLGLSRADAWQEADKPFWAQPAQECERRSC